MGGGAMPMMGGGMQLPQPPPEVVMPGNMGAGAMGGGMDFGANADAEEQLMQ